MAKVFLSFYKINKEYNINNKKFDKIIKSILIIFFTDKKAPFIIFFFNNSKGV